MSLPLLRRVQRVERIRVSRSGLEIVLVDREGADGAGGLILFCNDQEVRRIPAAEVRHYRRATMLLDWGP